MNKSILLLTYHYPPSEEVGARRWAKLSRALANNGFDMHVVTVADKKVPVKEIKTNDKKIVVHTIHNVWPVDFHKPAAGIFQRIKRKLLLYFLRWKEKGAYYDRGILLRKKIIKCCKKVISQHNISAVIATGAPFSFLRYATQLKIKDTTLTVICDLRDPWTDGYFYGFSQLNAKRKKKEEEYEKSVMTNVDYVLTPAPVMTRNLRAKYSSPGIATKFETVFHPYDAGEMAGLTGENEALAGTGKKIQLLTGGTIDLKDIEAVFSSFLKALDVIREKNRTLYDCISVDIYSETKKLRPLLEKHKHSIIQFREKVPAKDFLSVASQASFLVIFLPGYVKDYFITKFTEYVALKKPLIVFAPGGELACFVEENNLGFVFDYNNPDSTEKFMAMIQQMKEGKYVFNTTFNEKIFSADIIARQISEYLK